MSRPLVLTGMLFLALPAIGENIDVEAEVLDCRAEQDLSKRLNCYDRIADRLDPVNARAPLTSTAPVTKTATTPKPVATPAPVAAPAGMVSQPVVTSRPAKPASSVSAAPTPTPSPASAAPETSVDPEALFGKSTTEAKRTVEKELAIVTVDEIRSLVSRAERNASREYVVWLENGQVWKQKSDVGNWRIKEGETAIISAASLGSYLMRSDARKKSVRAERLK